MLRPLFGAVLMAFGAAFLAAYGARTHHLWSAGTEPLQIGNFFGYLFFEPLVSASQAAIVGTGAGLWAAGSFLARASS